MSHQCIFEHMFVATCNATSMGFCTFVFTFSIMSLFLWVLLCFIMSLSGFYSVGHSIFRGCYRLFRRLTRRVKSGAVLEKALPALEAGTRNDQRHFYKSVIVHELKKGKSKPEQRIELVSHDFMRLSSDLQDRGFQEL